MSAPVRAAHEVDAAVPAVLAALTSEAWPRALAERLSDGSELVERTALPDGGVRVVVRRRLPDGVPSPLQRFLPADGTVLQTDVWHAEDEGVPGPRTGTWEVAFAGAPGSLGGTTRLEPAGEGPDGAPRSRWVVEGEVVLRIPLVGGRAEGFLAPLVERLVERQAEVLRDLLG